MSETIWQILILALSLVILFLFSLMGPSGFFLAVFILVGIVGTVFWLWMLIDCLRRDFKDKLIWVIVLIFTHLLGAILYYFIVMKRKERKR